MIIDSHCHLNFSDFQDDLDDVLKRASENDVSLMQTICTKISEFDQILSIANTYQNIFCSVGNHPCDVKEEGVISIEELVKHTNFDKVIGIGETGLDFYHDTSNKDDQIKSFINHISAARETNLPIIIHTRDAEDETYDIIKSEMNRGRFMGVIHCFTGTHKFANKMIDLGLYISISGIVTFRNATALQNIVKTLPMDRILIETDSPYLAPTPYRGKRNEPSFVRSTALFLSNLKNVSYEDFAKITTDNFFKLFNKATI